MPRLRYIEESEKTPHTRELIESAKRIGAPDPRVVSVMTRSKLGVAWVGTSCCIRAYCPTNSRKCVVSRSQSRIDAVTARRYALT